MRMAAETIRLGSHAWLVRPLTLAQVQAIEPLLFASGTTPTGSVAAAVAILRVALARDHAEAAATLDDVEAPAPEIAAAMSGVLRLGGFLPVQSGDVVPGEAGAGLPPAT
jgi:hypothetical protein